MTRFDEVARCFQRGDAKKIDTFFRDCMCPDSELPNDCSMCDDDTIEFCDMFRRFQKAAAIVEGPE